MKFESCLDYEIIFWENLSPYLRIKDFVKAIKM